ncbi:MAG: hypothetical protein EPN77_19395 [Candidimonas sp.]|nr:MAG: hypothetical protein EPN77_19395 [Candidimonas sp.]
MNTFESEFVTQEPATAGAVRTASKTPCEARTDLTDPAYIDRCNAMWKVKPKSVIVIEYFGDGDPHYGGAADDRALGVDGKILLSSSSSAPAATFATVEDAHLAAVAIPNRRANSILGVIPSWTI